MSEGKQKLIELEKTGEYFFHGSPNEVEVFEPRQSHTDINGIHTPDGDPAVSASPDVDYAIFMAIFNMKNCPKGFTSRTNTSAEGEDSDEYKLSFLATKEALKQLTEDASGWVYVFKKEDFPFKKAPSEYRSHVHVSPVDRILVKKEDLPEVNEII